MDSTIVRAHQHAAGARTDPPPAPASKGAGAAEHQGEAPWQSLLARPVEVVREARAWAARAINRLKQSRAVATRYDKRGYVFLGAATTAALLIWLRG
ncbi:hypothetical protein SUDANB21_04799 [Streptomyces sp. enrichment culture]|jgi:hypothetical protein